jgi:hypothetical protein
VGSNPDPFTVNTKLIPAAIALDGTREVMLGIGLPIVMVNEFEVPPPGEGLATVTSAGPMAAMSLEGMLAMSCEVLTNVVMRLLPLHCTTDVWTKFAPFTVRVKAAPPAGTTDCDSDVKVGTGFAGGGGVEPPPQPACQRAAVSNINPREIDI